MVMDANVKQAYFDPFLMWTTKHLLAQRKNIVKIDIIQFI